MIRYLLALTLTATRITGPAEAQAVDESAKIYSRLAKLAPNAEIEVTLRTGGVRLSGHLERFDKRQLVLAERSTAPATLADIKAVKEIRPRRQPAVRNPATGFAR